MPRHRGVLHRLAVLLGLRTRSRRARRAAGPAPQWTDFEYALHELFRRDGFQWTRDPSKPIQEGADGLVCKDDQYYLVQCKHWAKQHVGINFVRAWRAVQQDAGACGGFIATAGQFTLAARDYADRNGIALIEARDLARIRATAHPAPSAAMQMATPLSPSEATAGQ
jgi:restriction endonuclease Mrr